MPTTNPLRRTQPMSRITGRQLVAARHALRLTQARLADESGITEQTIRAIENERVTARPMSARLIRRTLQAAGLWFEPDGRILDRDRRQIYPPLDGERSGGEKDSLGSSPGRGP